MLPSPELCSRRLVLNLLSSTSSLIRIIAFKLFSTIRVFLGRPPGPASVHTHFRLREMFVPGNISLPWISAFLQELSSTFLDTIILKLKADNLEDLRVLDSECGVREIHPVLFDDLEALDWTSLESSITTGRLPSLKRIVIEGTGSGLRFLSFMHIMHTQLRPLLQLRKVR
ncbi:hypothetical protein BC629DRAFT_1055450 [Irpex lacteus]|nr:hypothetical protein BC629DRAFT_1055450 [Irpex lacteus]